jgi:CIC family chloride channel protein
MREDVDQHEYQALRRLALKLGEWLDRLQPSAEVVALGTSLIVGLGTGLSAVGFNLLIQFVTRASFEWLPSLVGNARWPVLVVPAVGGLIAGPLIYNFAREAKGHGVPEVMQAMALRGGRIRPIVAVIKALASSVTIGTGGSVGREGPIVQIGAALGSTLGQIFHFSDERIRNLVACGAAGGIAATFNAPIAGVVFALEIILGELTAGHVGTVVVSAVTASAVMRAILGAEFAFAVPQAYELESPVEFIFYAVLGVLSAFVAYAFVRTLYAAEDFFEKQPFVPEWLQPAAGGLMLGGVALAYPLLFPELSYQGLPQVFGGGYPPITAALAGQEAIHIALVLMVLKMIATNLTLGSGGSGGVFAPALFMGAMLGTATGRVLGLLFPGITAPPGAYALVGMGAVFAGSAHAPITAVVMLFELTGDYRIILPLMLTIVISTVVARTLLNDESIYTLKLSRRGIRLQRGRDVDVLESVRVDEIMTQDDYAVSTDQTLVDLSETFSHERHHGFPVLDEYGRLWGVVTITDLERAVAANKGRRTPVTEIGTPYERLLVAFPDEPVGVVLRRMSPRGLGRLPVVSREDPHRLVGMVRREDVIRAYNVALARRSELAHRTRRMQRRHVDGTEFVEVELDNKDLAIGKRVGEVAQEMPDDCILVSIHRDGNTLIPHGDTILRAGDRVTAFVRSEYATRLFDCMKSPGDGPPPE